MRTKQDHRVGGRFTNNRIDYLEDHEFFFALHFGQLLEIPADQEGFAPINRYNLINLKRPSAGNLQGNSPESAYSSQSTSNPSEERHPAKLAGQHQKVEK